MFKKWHDLACKHSSTILIARGLVVWRNEPLVPNYHVSVTGCFQHFTVETYFAGWVPEHCSAGPRTLWKGQ